MIVTEQSQRRFFRRVLAASVLASVWVLSPLGECAVYAADTGELTKNSTLKVWVFLQEIALGPDYFFR